MTFVNARRRPSPLQTQLSRGPHRHRWERKEHPAFPDKIVIGLALLVLSAILFYWTSLSSSSSQLNQQQQQAHKILLLDDETTTIHHADELLKHPPLRGHHDHKSSSSSSSLTAFLQMPPMADAIIVGSGLAGQTAALTILDRGGTVILVEKEPILGGNSNKASSGINGCCTQDGNTSATFNLATNDTLELFVQDTFRSAGSVADAPLVETLVHHSASAIQWLEQRVGVDLTAPLVQLGGHSRKRTHRPTVGFVGAEMMNAMETALRVYEAKGYARILVDTKVITLGKDSLDQVRGVQVVDNHKGETEWLRSDSVILATGGFASDRSPGSLLRQYRPELANMAATAGLFSTGDGIHLASNLGATLRDMEKIQIHPTGFVDPADPTSPNKVLAAELLRGVGGILLNQIGQRFCNELGTRSYVTDKMLEHNAEYKQRREWKPDAPIPTFYLLLSSQAAIKAQKHVDTYMRKGLITKYHGLTNLARHLNIPLKDLAATLQEYQSFASRGGSDPFGKTVFEGLFNHADLDEQDFYVGEVTPVLHYCMGGLKINPSGQVLRSDGSVIAGLYAIGEVTGGVHGDNRLGGNSLLECAVFGSIVGNNILVKKQHPGSNIAPPSQQQQQQRPPKILTPQIEFKLDDLAKHNRPDDCFVGLEGKVYDLTLFIERHPGGKTSITSLCGLEATEIFSSVHSVQLLTKVEQHTVGILTEQSAKVATTFKSEAEEELQVISKQVLKQHNSIEDCWVVIFGHVYDLTEFAIGHPGGAYIIQKRAGKDATEAYQVFHPKDKLGLVKPFLVGKFVDDS